MTPSWLKVKPGVVSGLAWIPKEFHPRAEESNPLGVVDVWTGVKDAAKEVERLSSVNAATM